MTDLKNPFWIHLKGLLFLVILGTSAALIILQMPTSRIAALICLTIWASARLYYYLFYVIEHYIDPSYKFSGIYSALRYLVGKKPGNEPSTDSEDPMTATPPRVGAPHRSHRPTIQSP